MITSIACSGKMECKILTLPFGSKYMFEDSYAAKVLLRIPCMRGCHNIYVYTYTCIYIYVYMHNTCLRNMHACEEYGQKLRQHSLQPVCLYLPGMSHCACVPELFVAGVNRVCARACVYIVVENLFSKPILLLRIELGKFVQCA